MISYDKSFSDIEPSVLMVVIALAHGHFNIHYVIQIIVFQWHQYFCDHHQTLVGFARLILTLLLTVTVLEMHVNNS